MSMFNVGGPSHGLVASATPIATSSEDTKNLIKLWRADTLYWGPGGSCGVLGLKERSQRVYVNKALNSIQMELNPAQFRAFQGIIERCQESRDGVSIAYDEIEALFLETVSKDDEKGGLWTWFRKEFVWYRDHKIQRRNDSADEPSTQPPQTQSTQTPPLEMESPRHQERILRYFHRKGNGKK
ncbi:MAG: hypothetical protein Q9220_006285 [cf. Caloplaca sp. 1 TL-2023]